MQERWISPLAVRFSQGKIHPFFHERGPISEAGRNGTFPSLSLFFFSVLCFCLFSFFLLFFRLCKAVSSQVMLQIKLANVKEKNLRTKPGPPGPGPVGMKCIATRNKGIATRNKKPILAMPLLLVATSRLFFTLIVTPVYQSMLQPACICMPCCGFDTLRLFSEAPKAWRFQKLLFWGQ